MAARGGKGAGWKRRQTQIPHMQTGQAAAEQQALPRDQNCELNEGVSYARLFCFHLAFQAPACFSISPTLALSSESKRMKRNKTAKKREHKERGTRDANDKRKKVCAPTTEENVRVAAGGEREEGRKK